MIKSLEQTHLADGRARALNAGDVRRDCLISRECLTRPLFLSACAFMVLRARSDTGGGFAAEAEFVANRISVTLKKR